MLRTVHPWWSSRWFVAMLAVLATVPLWWPSVPPLVDLPGHMGRYAVQLAYDGSPALRRFYTFEWSLIGNLGIDLLIIPVSQLFGVELGTKLIVMAIPALKVAGLLWIAREVHGYVPPTALFALPLAYGHPFMFGFVNFAMAMALALLAFALWLRLARLNRLRLRAALFVVIGPLLWVTHTFGWGTLGVLAFSAELIRQHDRDANWLRAGFWAGVHCLSLAPPILLMLAWRSGHVGGQTADWFNWRWKWLWVQQILRDRWQSYDIASVALLIALIPFALVHRALSFSRNLAASALILLAVFLILPRIVFGSAYADMRLTPYVLAIAIVAIRIRPGASRGFATGLALAGLAFFGLRIATNTVSLAIDGVAAERAMGALAVIPRGARLVSFVGDTCAARWPLSRLAHLPGMAIVRRHAYSNDQWSMAGAQLLTVAKTDAGRFGGDPSQVVTAEVCRRDKWRSLDWSLANLPRDAFDYVWLIHPPRFDPAGLRGMTLLWSNGPNALYRIDDRAMPQRP
ncbi:MAG: hypothetical protein ACKVOP_10355 [Sphingomonadaceae bacterium]